MQLWEIFVMGAALAMDAVAVSLADGMAEPRMRALKMLFIAGLFGLFQGLMPLFGYYLGSAFASLIGKIAPYLSFVLLAFIGGKMIFDGIREGRNKRKGVTERRETGTAKLVLQAVATSIDALAVGVTLLAAETAGGLPAHILLCALIIAAVTFALSLPAVLLGRKFGDAFSDKAELLGGAVLILIGLKLLLEGIL